MRKFELIEPKSLWKACVFSPTKRDARAIAGGTALLTIIKQGLLLPKLLVNLKKIGDASAITFDPVQGLRNRRDSDQPRTESCIEAETLANGKALTPDSIATIAAEAARNIDPIDDVRGPADYKRHLMAC